MSTNSFRYCSEESSTNCVGTLAPLPQTCSGLAAQAIHPAASLRGFFSFEAAINAVKRRRIDTAFVPAAYPGVHRFIQDPELTVTSVALHQIPKLVFAGNSAEPPNEAALGFLHPATRPLLRFVSTKIRKTVDASSNAAAATQIRGDVHAVGITNEVCANDFGLTTYAVLAQPVMPFLSFGLA